MKPIQNKDFFNYYNSLQIEDKLNRVNYYKVIDLYCKFLANKLLLGKRVTLPNIMGSLCFLGKKANFKFDENGNIKGLPINWGETNKLWKDKPELKGKNYVYFTNEHTEGYIYSLKWSYKLARGKYKPLYVFTPSRIIKKSFAYNINNKLCEYNVEE